jgi:peptidoglycan/xylan/chitin deacetylase (PgdA/CDA1 family)
MRHRGTQLTGLSEGNVVNRDDDTAKRGSLWYRRIVNFATGSEFMISPLDRDLAELQQAAEDYATRHQFIGDFGYPPGIRIAVNFTLDFDSMLLRRLLNEPPMQLAKGEFGGRVGIWRLIELFDAHRVKATIFTPGRACDDAMFFSFAWLGSENAAQRITDPERVFDLWWAAFRQQYREGGYLNICMHPFVSGRASRVAMVDRLITRMKMLPSVWFPSCEEVARWCLEKFPPRTQAA